MDNGDSAVDRVDPTLMVVSLPPLSDRWPRNRLGLARWLTEPQHPLAAYHVDRLEHRRDSEDQEEVREILPEPGELNRALQMGRRHLPLPSILKHHVKTTTIVLNYIFNYTFTFCFFISDFVV